VQLWTDELEARRAETRTAIDSTLPAILELMGRTDDTDSRGAAAGLDRPVLDRDVEVARARESICSQRSGFCRNAVGGIR